LEYLTKTYVAYHGSNEGLESLLLQAKNSAFSPEGFSIESARDIAAKKAAQEEDFLKAHPDLGL
jgi:hypothetical protein